MDDRFSENEHTGPFTRSASRSSLRASLRASKAKIDDFFRTPVGKRKRYDIEPVPVPADTEEPSKKRLSSMAKFVSLAQLLTPMKSTRKVGQALQLRALSVRNLVSPVSMKKPHVATPYKRPAVNSNLMRRLSTSYWHETIDGRGVTQLDANQLKRQEAIFELYKSEMDLIDDIKMVKMTYDDSMRKLSLMSNEELEQIFSPLYQLLPVHEALVEALRDQRMPDGTTENIGQVIIDWVPKLEAYVSYCANQVYVKALFDAKKMDPSVDDFLQRCLESPFSRRLDVWSYLDVPRSRLVKYPLLLKNIQNYTPSSHEDHTLLEKAVNIVEELISNVDYQTGLSKCAFTVSIMDFLDVRQKHPLIYESKFILCEGVLSTSRGVKLNVFLFDLVLVLTRPCSRGEQKRYQVYRNPIAVSELLIENRQSSATSMTRKGSFRNAFSQSNTGNNSFVVSASGRSSLTYTLYANDELDKNHWLHQLKTAVKAARGSAEAIAVPVKMRRHRSGSIATDEANVSITSHSSYASLASINSTSTIASEYSTQSLRSLKRCKFDNVGSSSSIVTK